MKSSILFLCVSLFVVFAGCQSAEEQYSEALKQYEKELAEYNRLEAINKLNRKGVYQTKFSIYLDDATEPAILSKEVDWLNASSELGDDHPKCKKIKQAIDLLVAKNKKLKEEFLKLADDPNSKVYKSLQLRYDTLNSTTSLKNQKVLLGRAAKKLANAKARIR